MRSALIALQVASSFILLAGAGLLARSALALQDVDAGFRADRVLTMRIDLDFVKYDTVASRRDFFRSVLETVQAEPGVTTAALSFDVPLDIAHTMRRELLVEGDSSPPHRAPADLKFTSPAYFDTIGMSRLSGRLFTSADTAEAPRIAVVNLALAQHYFSGADPVGRRVSLDDGTTWITIVGVVNDVRQHDLALSASDELYQPFARTGSLNATLLFGTAGDPEELAQGIAAVVRRIDRRQAVSRVQTLQAIRGRSLEPPRLTAMLVALFAMVALAVTAIGIAGVVSFSVTRRTVEIGVRMALGAPRREVTAMIVREGLTPAAIGLVGGLVAALAMTQVSRQLLFGIEPTDPLTYGAALAALTATASIACLVPARRAAAVDPLRALRADS